MEALRATVDLVPVLYSKEKNPLTHTQKRVTAKTNYGHHQNCSSSTPIRSGSRSRRAKCENVRNYEFEIDFSQSGFVFPYDCYRQRVLLCLSSPAILESARWRLGSRTSAKTSTLYGSAVEAWRGGVHARCLRGGVAVRVAACGAKASTAPRRH